MITYHKGDLLDSNCDYIAQQVNLQGFMGGGLARQIAKKYPNVEKIYEDFAKSNTDLPANYVEAQENENEPIVVNCFTQDENYNTVIDWLEQCFTKLKEEIYNYGVPVCIGILYKYGCGIARGNWADVEKVFKKLFEKDELIELQIWEYTQKTEDIEQYQKEYAKKNKESLNKAARERYYAHKEKRLEYQRKYEKENRENHNINTRRWRLRHKESYQEYQKRYYQEHKEKLLTQHRISAKASQQRKKELREKYDK